MALAKTLARQSLCKHHPHHRMFLLIWLSPGSACQPLPQPQLQAALFHCRMALDVCVSFSVHIFRVWRTHSFLWPVTQPPRKGLGLSTILRHPRQHWKDSQIFVSEKRDQPSPSSPQNERKRPCHDGLSPSSSSESLVNPLIFPKKSARGFVDFSLWFFILYFTSLHSNLYVLPCADFRFNLLLFS